METLKIKRKKRKTRRCLDELRKKTHQTNSVCKVNKNADAKIHKHKSNSIKNNYITSNRLTLFNKAVRSETVTRFQLSELESKKFKSNKNEETVTSNLRTNADCIYTPIEQNNNKIVLETQNPDVTEDNNGKEISSQILINGKIDSEVETPKSALLFSPESQNAGDTTNYDSQKSQNARDTANYDSPLETSLISSSPTTITDTDLKAKVYVDMMDHIEHYLRKNFSHCINTDMIENAEAKLRNLCSEYKTKNNLCNTSSDSEIMSQDVLSNSSSSSPEVQIIQNPREYLEYSWNQLSEANISEVHESSPMESTSSSSISIHIPSTSPVVSAVYDTPEYKYYPHRLNN